MISVSSRGRLTEADHDRIRQLAARKLGPKTIADDIGKHPSTVAWFMYREGLRAPRQVEQPKHYDRNGKTVYRFSAEEDAFIEALRSQGFHCAEIARMSSKRFGIDRKMHAVRCRLVMLAAREAAA